MFYGVVYAYVDSRPLLLDARTGAKQDGDLTGVPVW